MLVIRDAQFEVHGVDLRRRRDAALVEALAVRFPALADAGRDGFVLRVMAALARANRYGFNRQDHLRMLAELDLQRGAEWELAEGADWARAILDQPDVDAAGRLHRLLKQLTRRDSYGR